VLASPWNGSRMEKPAIPEILWFKTVYVPAEDRLRFTCALRGGDSDSLWLTQRMASALVAKLVEWLDKTSVQDQRFAGETHRAAQQSALTTRPKKAPREAIPETEAWLVHAVNLKSIRRGLLLTFRDAGERAVCIAFDAPRLRQWLQVLHGVYRRSGWPMDAWPDWMAELAGDKAPEERGLLH
jgi:hypothetical protein